MENPQKLTKEQKRELRKQEWQEKAQEEVKKEQYKKVAIWVGVALAIILGIFGLAMLVNSSSNSTTSSLKVPVLNDKDLYTKGDKKAKVTLTEYGDFQCPACASYHPIVKAIIEEYKDKILFIYRDFPLINAHKYAHLSSRAAFAANKQNKYWEMYDLLYQNQNSWAKSTKAEDLFVDYAKELGLDIDKFSADLNSSEAKTFVDESLATATGLGINSTPSFFINGVKIDSPSSFDEFKEIIDNELNKK
ncbi:MAG: DsbA family protein [Patescibacteria group bacterium]